MKTHSKRAVSRTVSIALLEETLSIAALHGADAEAALNAAAIEKSLLRLQSGRISANDYGRVWLAVADQMDDEFFGEDARPLRRGSFALMSQAALSSTDGAQAIRTAIAFMRVVLDNIEARIERHGDIVRLCIDHRREKPSMFAYATYFILVYGLLCWLVDRRIPILATDLQCDEPQAVEEYRLIFCADLRFSATHSFVDLSADFLSLPIVQTVDTLQQFLRRAPGNIVAKYRRDDSLAMRVISILKSTPVHKWPDGDQMAHLLAMAPATMRRRLKAEGMTYQRAKDRTRCRMALELLEHSEVAVADIATAVGYAEPSAFFRAFRKWTGMSPASYRP